jgi:CHAD domain-containing protein
MPALANRTRALQSNDRMAGEQERAHKALRELSKSLKSLHGDLLPKNVHKLRTATRRVEAIAAAMPPTDGKKSNRLLKSIEPVRKAAGGVRDMDVLIANARKLARYAKGDSLNRLLAALADARQQNAEELRHALERDRGDARTNLKHYARLVRSELSDANSAAQNGKHGPAHDSFHAQAANVTRELAEWPPLNESNIHEFRLKVKQLRYIQQLDADADPAFAEALGDVQRRIGDWHDWQQLEEIARQLLHPERDAALLARISQTTKRRYARAIAAANALRAKYLAAPLAVGI